MGGARIRWLMQEQGISASELAKLVGVQRSHISNILADRKKPSIDLALRLSRVLGVTVNDLMRMEGFGKYERCPKR